MNAKNKKYIFVDIDGTIFDTDGKIPKSAKYAIKQAQVNGHEVFICSGRAKNVMPQNLLNLNFDGLLAGTGTYIEYKNKTIYKNYINKTQIKKVSDLFEKHKISFMMSSINYCIASEKTLLDYVKFFTNGEIVLDNINIMKNISIPFLDTLGEFVIDNDILSYPKKYDNVNCMVYVYSSLSIDQLNDLLGPDLHVEIASFKNACPTCGEITLSECTKSTSISRLLDFVNAPIESSISIGDGFNDIDMLKFTNVGIAMGNAHKEVKEIADYVTDDVGKDGLFKAFKHFNLI